MSFFIQTHSHPVLRSVTLSSAALTDHCVIQRRYLLKAVTSLFKQFMTFLIHGCLSVEDLVCLEQLNSITSEKLK